MAGPNSAGPTGYKKSTVREYFESICIAVILALFVRTFVVQAFKIPTGSMENNLLIGDHLLVNKFVFAPTLNSLERTLLPIDPVRRGDILVFNAKRIGREFEPKKWFAMIEGGKWVGAAIAAFNGTVVAANEELERRPKLLNQDPFGEGWMLVVRPSDAHWQANLVTGADVGPAFAAWLASGAYKDRTG